jgi:hypothetical protein
VSEFETEEKELSYFALNPTVVGNLLLSSLKNEVYSQTDEDRTIIDEDECAKFR